MTTYETIDSAWKELEGFDGAPVMHPKYQCKLCGEPIEESYTWTSEKCYFCNEDKNEVGEYVEQVFTVSIYFRKDITNDHDLSKEVRAAKEGEHSEKMAKILEWGMKKFSQLSDAEALVPPPSGSGEEYNHMVDIGERLSQKTGLPLRDVTYKLEDYPAQKELDQKERKENVRDNIGCDEDLNDISKAVVIDDIVTTCTTISDTARAVKEAGVDTVYGLGIARSVSFEGLVHAEALEVVENED